MNIKFQIYIKISWLSKHMVHTLLIWLGKALQGIPTLWQNMLVLSLVEILQLSEAS